MSGTEPDFSRLVMQNNLSPRYVSKRDIAKHFGVSERTIDRYRQFGIFRQGEHYIRKFPNSKHTSLLFMLEKCDEAYRQEFVVNQMEPAK